MSKNNKNGSIAIILIIIVIIGTLLYIFIPKDMFSKKKSSTFGSFNSDRKKITGTPSSLNWRKSFVYEKENEKKGQSYMKFMIDKKKNEK